MIVITQTAGVIISYQTSRFDEVAVVDELCALYLFIETCTQKPRGLFYKGKDVLKINIGLFLHENN